jgi:hypothetical protein
LTTRVCAAHALQVSQDRLCPSCLHVTLGLGSRHLRTSLARAPYRLRAALRRCGARLWGSCASVRLLGLGAAVRGVGRGRDTLRRAVGVCARALAARALLRRACALVMRSAGLGAAGAGLEAPLEGFAGRDHKLG